MMDPVLPELPAWPSTARGFAIFGCQTDRLDCLYEFMAIDISILFTPHWARLEPHLKIDTYDKDGGHVDPRIRIGFVDLPEAWSRELVMFTMPCVACQRPSHPLRRREGDGWDRLFYAPTCTLAVRIACSRSRAAELEYERFKGMPLAPRPAAQLELLV